ncbi:MAG: DUF790 family protein, partial [Gemmatimonadota bacterium]
VPRDGRTLRYTLDHRAPVGRPHRGARYDSSFERALAEEFADKVGDRRGGWTLAREATPVALGAGELFLPDFTLRHDDGREALVEIVGFWTPEYLEAKLRKVAAAGLDRLILVVYRGLAAGDEGALERLAEAAAGPVLTFANRPKIGPVVEAAERVARRGG